MENKFEENDLVKKSVDFGNVSENLKICEKLTRNENLQELPIVAVMSYKSQPLAAPPRYQKMGGGRGQYFSSKSEKEKKNMNFEKTYQIENYFKKRGNKQKNVACTVDLTCAILTYPEQALQGRLEDGLPPNPSRQAAQLSTQQARTSVCTTADPPTNHHSAAGLQGTTDQSEKGPGSCDCKMD